MNCDVPMTWFSPLSWGTSGFASGSTKPKSSSLATSSSPPRRETERLDGLISRWIRPNECASRERLPDLTQQLHHPPRRQWSVPLDQLREAQARQIFHHVIVCSAVCSSVVVNLQNLALPKDGQDQEENVDDREFA